METAYAEFVGSIMAAKVLELQR